MASFYIGVSHLYMHLWQCRFGGSYDGFEFLHVVIRASYQNEASFLHTIVAEGRHCTPYVHIFRSASKSTEFLEKSPNCDICTTCFTGERLRRFEIICAVNSTSSGYTALNWVTYISGSVLKKSFYIVGKSQALSPAAHSVSEGWYAPCHLWTI